MILCGRYRFSRLDKAFLAREFGLREEDIPEYADELDNAPPDIFRGRLSQNRCRPEAGQIGDNAVGEMKRAIERERQRVPPKLEARSVRQHHRDRRCYRCSCALGER